MSLQFVDTNVFLYAYDGSAGDRHDKALELVSTLGRNREGALSVQVLQEFYVNAVRKIARPLAPDVARDRLQALGLWTVHAPTAEDVVAAAEISESASLSFCDAMIVRSAASLGCATLWSEDLNAGQLIEGVTIRNPFV